MLFTLTKCVITIDGNIKINVAPSHGLYTLGQNNIINNTLQVGQSGLYCCDCPYYTNLLGDSSKNHTGPTHEHCSLYASSGIHGGMNVKYEYIYSALALLHRCYGHIHVSRLQK